MMRVGPALLPLLALAGCTLALDYQGSDESLACHGGVDDDFDGLVDCADPDCRAACDERTQCTGGVDDDEDGATDCDDSDCDGSGVCVEASEERCTDRRDNDGDGRRDGRDAGCWPFLPWSVERCASVLGSDLVLGPRDFSGGELDEAFPGELWRQIPASSDGAPTVVETWPATGSAEGLHATGVLHHAGDPLGGFLFSIAEGIGERGPGASIGVVVGRRTAELGGVYVGEATRVPFVVGEGLARVDVDLRIAGDRMSVELTNADGATAHLEGRLAASPTAIHAARIELLATTGGTAWLESATLSMPRQVRCDGPQPPLGIQTGRGLERASTVLHGVARGEGTTLCAIAAMTVRLEYALYGVRSDDDGATWTRGSPLATGDLQAPGSAVPAIVAWDPIARTWHAASLREGLLASWVSSDCHAWHREEDTGVDLSGQVASNATPAAYDIDWSGHALAVPIQTDETTMLLTLRSPWGEPGTWTRDAPMALPVSPGTPSSIAPLWRIARYGATTFLADGGHELYVIDPGVPDGVRGPFLITAASGEAGAFDARAVVGAPTLLEDLDPADDLVFDGRVFYSGSYDIAPDEGWGFARVHVGVGESAP